jgi:protein O-GlcNAc transferase
MQPFDDMGIQPRSRMANDPDLTGEQTRMLEAEALLRRAIMASPADPALHVNHGHVLQRLGRNEQALERFARALDIDPRNANAYCYRARALSELGRRGEAVLDFDRALELEPHRADLHYSRGTLLQSLQRLDEAVEAYDRALAIARHLVEAFNNRGTALHELGRLEEALASYDRAIEIRQDYAKAHNNRGFVLQDLRRFDEALMSYRRAFDLKPDYAQCYRNYGITLFELGHFEEALLSFRRARTLMPDLIEAYIGEGKALTELKQVDAAFGCYDRARALNPDHEWLQGTWLHTKMQLCDFGGVERDIGAVAAKVADGKKATTPFHLVVCFDSPSHQREAAEIWGRHRYPPAYSPNRSIPHARRERIRLGYFSADFHNHATADLLAGVIEQHDRRHFEVLAFSFGREASDEMRTRLLASFDRFLDVRERSDAEVARLSSDLEIDIAIDLKGYTQDSRPGIFARRAAPIQVSYLGYPGTMGVPYIDYLIADRTVIPAEQREYYTEKVIYLPDCYQANDDRRAIDPGQVSRAQLGLPERGFVFCCFNNSYKLTQRFFEIWMRLLGEVNDSVLWLLEGHSVTQRNLRSEARSQGIDPARLIFAPRWPRGPHLARHRAADLFLDTLPCNAHTTASDALWAGLPLLTCLGESFAGRVAGSLLQGIGIPELVTRSPTEYEGMALELARNTGRLTALRGRLAANREHAALFDTQRFTRNLESAFRGVHERFHSGLPPGDLLVPP